MKLPHIKNISWIILVILLILSVSKVATTQEIPRNDRITVLNQQLQRAIDSGNTRQALKITDILIKELNGYRSTLRETIESRVPGDSLSKYPDNRQRFERQLVLQQSLAYRDSRQVCVMGKIRNNSRSEIVNPVYVIADFIAPSGQGVRSQEPVVRINLIIKQFFLLIPSLPNRV